MGILLHVPQIWQRHSVFKHELQTRAIMGRFAYRDRNNGVLLITSEAPIVFQLFSECGQRYYIYAVGAAMAHACAGNNI